MTDGVQSQVRNIVTQTRAAIGEINGVAVVDHTKYEFMEERLAQLLTFDDFSLVEVSFPLPGGSRPGIRLWLDGPADRRRIRLIFFEDVVQWRIDYSGEKVSTTLLTLKLGPEGISVAENTNHEATTWQPALTATFTRLAEQLRQAAKSTT